MDIETDNYRQLRERVDIQRRGLFIDTSESERMEHLQSRGNSRFARNIGQKYTVSLTSNAEK
jgi:hypothetical protein